MTTGEKTRRAPRSGGRTAEQPEFRVDGTAALAPEPVGPASGRTPGTDRAARGRLRVAPPPPVSVPRTPFILLLLLFGIGGVLGILLLNTKTNQNAFVVHDLRESQQALDLRQQQLEQQIAQHESPGNLAAAARKLGLVPAGAPAFIRLPDGKVIGVPQPASGQLSVASQPGGR